MTALEITRGHVVEDGVAKYMAHCVGLGDPLAVATDDHRNLSLIVDLFADLGQRDRIAGAGHTGGEFGKDDRIFGNIASLHLGDMIAVILTHTEYGSRRL